MSKKRKFSTTHALRLDTIGGSPFKTFDTFAIGGVAGFYRTNTLTLDFMVQAITVGEHLVDTIEWFSEIARSLQLFGIRVLSCTDAELQKILIDHHDFRHLETGVLFKQTIETK